MKKYLIIAVCLIINYSLFAQVITIQSANAKELLAATQNNYFRVVIKGFTCNTETADDMLERDGKGDEIYFSSLSVMVNNAGQTIPSTTVRNRTRTMGDINNRAAEEKRVMAGSALGALGGIRSGDNLPDFEPWKNSAKAKGDLLPFVLWEGNLHPNNDYVIIHPNIMEWDGPADFLTNFWNSSIIAGVTKLATGVASIPFKLITGNGLPGGLATPSTYDDSQPGIWPAPTVMQQFGSVFFRIDLDGLSTEQKNSFIRTNMVVADRPADRPIGVSIDNLSNSTQNIYNPLQIRLDYNNANLLANKDFGYGKGIIPIKYKDADQFKGDYTVYVSIEKVNNSFDQNGINITSQDVFDPLANYSLRNVFANDKEADILGGGTQNNTHVVLNDLKGLSSQRWKIKKANQYYFSLTNNYNNLSLDLLNKNDGNGSNIVVSSYDGGETQQWGFIRYCDGSWVLRNVKTKRVVEVYNAAKNVLAPLGQWDNTHAANQRWFIEK